MVRFVHRLPRRLRALLMLATGVMVTIVVSQCRLVDDRVLAPSAQLSASESRSGACIRTCARTNSDAKTAEDALNAANIAACAGDPVCLANEEARHVAAINAINEARKACMDACHHQGGGSGGR